MPNDTALLDITDTDNDDIVDLLEIVKPGNAVPLQSAAPEKIDDFSADLDAILGQEAEKDSDPAAPTPFPDPTPVDHAVDPDETLNMPSMDDLNHLLASLGAEATPAADNPPPPAEGKSAALPDLDAVPLSGQQSALSPSRQDAPNVPLDLDFDPPEPRTAPNLAPSPQPATAMPDLAPSPPPAPAALNIAPLPQPATAMPDLASSPKPAPATPDLADDPQPEEETPLEIQLQEPEAPQGEEIVQPPALPAIEALFAENTPPPPSLPDMESLFSAQLPDEPAPSGVPDGPAPSDAPDEPAPPSDAQDLSGGQEPFGQPAQPMPTAQAAQRGPDPAERDGPAASSYDDVDLHELDALLEDMLASAPPVSSPPAQESKGKELYSAAADRAGPAQDLAPLRQSVSRVETGLADLKKELLEENSRIEKQQSSLAEQTALLVETGLANLKKELLERNALIEKQQSSLAEQTALIDELRHSLTSLHENMDKMAALSAAKVIREELASLLKDDPPAP
ncbi:MAG: hypothetical protein LBJ82_04095 [Deltaproteobacteria bacterium]|nr:hypothetical protein [Deltaproteobacteria bacterium]